MDRFTLDDAGDSFRIDIQTVLDGLAPRLSALATIAVPAGADGDLEAIQDGCQTITGSGAVLEARGLVAGAQALARLAGESRQVLGEIIAATHRLHDLLAAAESAMPALDRLLILELARQRQAADLAGTDLARRIDAAITGVPLVAEPVDADAEDGFSFDEPADAPSTVAEPAARSSGGTDVFTGDDAAIREAFAQEAVELLDNMDQQAAAMARGAAMEPLVRELFRAYHTFKGSANTVGLTALGAAAHKAEDELESWAPSRVDARIAATALMRVQTALRSALAPGGTVPEPAWIAQELQRALRHETDVLVIPPAESPATEAAQTPTPKPATEEPAEGNRRYLRVAARHLDGLMHLAGELVTTRSRLSTRVGILADAQRELASSRNRLVTTVDGFRVRNEFAGLDGRRQASRPFSGASATRPRQPGRPQGPGRVDALFTDLELDRYEDIHVLARSLSEITGDIGELQGQIQRAIADIGEDAEVLGRSVTGIQGEITRARMIPLDQLFTRIHLAVQDAAERSGRQVQVTLAGGAVALDKTIVDGLHTPLLHLVRNAVAHGIEPAQERQAAGKPGEGRIAITARQEGGQIIVEIADDGRGLDLPKLHRRGVELGLIDAGTAVDSEAVRLLVFAPGLSTAEGVDAVSGRGVGCDVARQEIQRLNGTIGATSTAGTGTTFTIVLPLTLAISRALLVVVGGSRFAIPMNFIERVLDLDQAEVSQAGGVRRVAWAGTQVRLVEMTSLLTELPPPERLPGAALLVRLGERRWALPVDALLRQEDIVVNSLGELLVGHPLFAGVTLSGTGQLVPILDIPGLLAASGALLAPGPTRPVRGVPVRPAAANAPRRILFVDDSVSVRRVAEQQLAALGCTVILATDGEDALAKLRSTPVDLVFTDLEMPKMHGYDLLREIRFIPAFQHLPVVVVSSRTGDKHRALAEQLGANDHLGKPFLPEQLRQAIERWVPRT